MSCNYYNDGFIELNDLSQSERIRRKDLGSSHRIHTPHFSILTGQKKFIKPSRKFNLDSDV
jgi:hypothetical protein